MVEIAAMPGLPAEEDDESVVCGARRMRALDVFFWRRLYDRWGVLRTADDSEFSIVHLVTSQ